jgi:hypothetical protein
MSRSSTAFSTMSSCSPVPTAASTRKADDLDAYRAGMVSIAQLDASDERIQRFGDIAVVSVRMDMSGSFKGEAFSGPFRYTRIWCARPGGWRIVAGHVSAVARAGS